MHVWINILPLFDSIFSSFQSRSSLSRSLPVVGSLGGTVGLKNLVVVGQGSLEHVLVLLVASPSGFALTLLSGELLVLVTDLLLVGGLSGVTLILEHTTHAKNGFLLGGEVLSLFLVHVLLVEVLTVLLGSPVALVLSVKSHSFVVHYKQGQKLVKIVGYKTIFSTWSQNEWRLSSLPVK